MPYFRIEKLKVLPVNPNLLKILFEDQSLSVASAKQVYLIIRISSISDISVCVWAHAKRKA